MAVPSISFYAASPPSTICSIDNQFQINSHASSDYDLNSRPPPPTKKPIVGGLSCLFSSSSVKHSSSSPSVKHSSSSGISSDDDLSSSYSYSNTFSLSSTFKCRDQSPVTVFDYPVSCSSSRCSSLRTTHDFNDNSGLQRSVKNNSESIFHGFVQNASGSCMDYDLSSFSVNMDSSMDYSDELTFDLEDNVNEGNCNLHTRELLKEAQSRHKIFYDEFVIKAFYEAERAHEGQMRASGDPYLQHCVETGVLLAMIGANSTVVTAGLLHDTLDDSSIDRDYIFHEFGADVVNLIEGVSKLSHLSKLARDNNTANRTDEADRLHTMFLAMTDARAVLIKLADRLHNMMTLEALPMVKQQRFAKETLEIFVPLANRLGISTWKEQLENMCFKYLYPKEYQNLSTKLARSNVDVPITCAVEKLEQALKDQDIQYHALSGRCKSLYSIYSKMIKKRIAIDEIHDIHGLRLIVDEKEDCYKALDIVHSLWPVVPGKFKDYINYPKFNGYQSLHTVVMGQDMVPLEVQIRTKEMHLQAEFGFASHWRYKEGDCRHSSYVTQMVEWARWVITWQCETASRDLYSKVADHQQFRLPCPFPSHLDDCPYSQVPEFDQTGPVFVIMIQNDKMSVQEFPPNSTVADLLERVGYSTTSRLSSSYGLPVKEELKPRLNHELVTNPQCKLKMGDMMELTTTIPAKSLTEYRKEIQRMYNHGLTVSTMSGWS